DRAAITRNTAVAYYGGPERIMKAVHQLGAPVCEAMFPRMARLFTQDHARASRVAMWALGGLLGLGLVGAILTWGLAGPMVRIMLGEEYVTASVPILRVLALSIPAVFVAQTIAFQWMIPHRMDRSLFWI